MSLVQGGDNKLKCYAILGYLTIEYLCIEKLGIGIAGFTSHFSSSKAEDFQISAWNPTLEGFQIIDLLSEGREPPREFFQAHLNRIGGIMRRFCDEPSSVPLVERAEMLRFVEAFCALCGYSPNDEVVRATRNFIEVETKSNMSALNQAALRKVASTPCFNPAIRGVMTAIIGNTLKSLI